MSAEERPSGECLFLPIVGIEVEHRADLSHEVEVPVTPGHYGNTKFVSGVGASGDEDDLREPTLDVRALS